MLQMWKLVVDIQPHIIGTPMVPVFRSTVTYTTILIPPMKVPMAMVHQSMVMHSSMEFTHGRLAGNDAPQIEAVRIGRGTMVPFPDGAF